MEGFGQTFRVPDPWQAEAVAHLRAGRDVVLHAPTGTGKTFVFELFFSRCGGLATYTVPTRALANDKYAQWLSEGWRVGISTGDRLENPDAPLLVATLETQRERILSGAARGLFVIDEYQLLGDSSRGAAYETAVAALPAGCRLLMMSGSVGNPSDVAEWLCRIGRDARLVGCGERAVPIDGICADALPEISARGVRGFWPSIVQRAAEADMCPMLIFAPKRRDAEAIACSLASELPCGDFLKLPREAESAAGGELSRLLKRRIAFHHSGLTAFRRAGIVEKYAREGALKAVVATTGLGAGVNFSMRSVIIADREYETPDGPKLLRPDELLQMYGRAGRRGKDAAGYAISLPGGPSLSQARPVFLERPAFEDWPAILRIMDSAGDSPRERAAAAEAFCKRLFSKVPPDLGFGAAAGLRDLGRTPPASRPGGRAEILNSRGLWERRRPQRAFRVSETLYRAGGRWERFDMCAEAVKSLKRGAVCALPDGRYGVFVELAKAAPGGWAPTRALAKIVRAAGAEIPGNPLSRKLLTLKNIRRNFQKYARVCLPGAECLEISADESRVRARLDISGAMVGAFPDSSGRGLFNPPARRADVSGEWDFGRLAGFDGGIDSGGPPAPIWRRLGLIDGRFALTRRGKIFSFFSKGEGLAVAAALEDPSYDVSDVAFDLANLRAGRRFSMSELKSGASTRMADACRIACLGATIPGYLRAGVPPEFGAGAAEIMRELRAGSAAQSLETPSVGRGDIERARLEWESLMRRVSAAPDLEWDRWLGLKRECARLLSAPPRAPKNRGGRAF